MKNSNFFALLALIVFGYGTPLSGQIPRDTLIKNAYKHLKYSDVVMEKSLDSAFYYTELAAELFKQAEDWNMYAISIGALGGVRYYQDRNEEAKVFYEKAIDISKEKLGQVSIPVLTGYAVSYYKNRGLYDEAIEVYLMGLQTRDKSSAEINYETVLLENIGYTYLQKGDLIQAERYLKQALRLRKEKGTSSKNAIIKNVDKLALCYRQMGRSEEAIHLLKENYRALKDEDYNKLWNSRRVDLFTQLCDLYLKEGKVDSAQYYIKEVLELQAQDNELTKALVFQLLGRLAFQQKRLPEAITNFKNGLEWSLEKHANFPYQTDIAESYQFLAEAQFEAGEANIAFELYQKALLALCPSQPEIGTFDNPSPEQYIAPNVALKILRSKALSLQQFSKSKEQKYKLASLNTYESALATIREVRKNYNSQQAKQLLAGETLPLFEGGMNVAWQLYEETKEMQYLEQMHAFAEGNKANLLLERLQETNAQGQGLLPDSILRKEQALRAEIAFYKEKIREASFQKKKNTEGYQRWEAILLDLEQKEDALQRQIAKKYPSYYQLKYDYQFVSVSQLQSLADEQYAILHYFIGNNSSFLFVLTPHSFEVFPIAYNETTREQIQLLRTISSTYPTSQNFLSHCEQLAETGHHLFQTLLSPVLKKDGLKNLIIIPDDHLNYLPFALLSRTKVASPKNFSLQTFDYLAEQYALSYAYSGTLLAQSYQLEKTGAKALWAGFAPSFQGPEAIAERGCQLDELYSLRCTQTEVENINKKLGGTTFLADGASKASFLSEAAQYRILHLATHACVDVSVVEGNRIFFTDGFISNADLSLLSLNAELAVLSACNTGSGALVKGEGVFSLARGFTLAGIPSTLTTLWSVNDCTTSEIMDGFYANIKLKQSKSVALQQAQLSYVQSVDEVYQHPYFWAAFNVYGNPESIDLAGGLPFWVWPLLLIGVAGIYFCWQFFFKKKGALFCIV